MERLTKRTPYGGVYFPSELAGAIVAPDNEIIYGLLTRLAAYEDTGMEPEEVTAQSYTLQGVMHSVDKWLSGVELKQDEVNRAAAMREKTLRIVEGLQAEVERLRLQIQTLEGGMTACLDEQTALAMCAGARAIENSKRTFGAKYVYGVFGEYKTIPYAEAAKLLREKAEPALEVNDSREMS